MPAKAKKAESSPTESGELTDEERREAVDEAIERSEKLAESELEMARLFLDRGQPDVARRRLQSVVERYGRSDAAREARRMLKRL